MFKAKSKKAHYCFPKRSGEFVDKGDMITKRPTESHKECPAKGDVISNCLIHSLQICTAPVAARPALDYLVLISLSFEKHCEHCETALH